MWATQLFTLALPAVMELASPRAWAYALLGIHEYCRRVRGDRKANEVSDALTRRLVQLHERNASHDWPWFEGSLSFDNAKLAHALILSGRETREENGFGIGLNALRWLQEIQTAEGGQFRPVGNKGWYTRGGVRAKFDQQPIEAHATLSACLDAFKITGDGFWLDSARTAFEWFLGRNDLGRAMYDAKSGACYDGLQIHHANLNQGAESTLSFLLSVAEIFPVLHALRGRKRPS